MGKKKYSEIVKWGLFYTLSTIGSIAFIFLCGEPTGGIVTEMYFIGNAIAIAVIIMCVYAGKKLHAAGLFPEKLYKEFEEEDV